MIWKFVYAPDPNIGLLNAILGIVHIGPISLLGDPTIVNGALIAVGIWASAGFATVILSAALKGIPTEILEAARTDGANECQIFFRIILPMVSLPMSVLAVTLVVNVVKLFDLSVRHDQRRAGRREPGDRATRSTQRTSPPASSARRRPSRWSC